MIHYAILVFKFQMTKLIEENSFILPYHDYVIIKTPPFLSSPPQLLMNVVFLKPAEE